MTALDPLLVPTVDDATHHGLDVDGGGPSAGGSLIRTRRGNAAAWAAANPVLRAGERGIELDTGVERLGDGATPFLSLAPLGGTRPWQFRVSTFGAAGDDSTDDTRAIRDAVDAAIDYALANNFYAEVLFDDLIYRLSADTTKGGDGLGNAQIPLRYIDPTTTRKVTLALRGAGNASSLMHWQQTESHRVGTVLRTTLTGQTADGTWGAPSVIGGPTVISGGGAQFSNMLVVVDGITVLAPHNPTVIGVDLFKCGQASIGTLCCIVDAVVGGTPNLSTRPTNDLGMGLRMPGPANNDNCDIQSYSTEGFYYGLGFSDHLNAFRLALIYCDTAMVVYGSGRMHGAAVHYASVEGCNTVIESLGGSGFYFPLAFGRVDVEVLGSTMIKDPNSTLTGYFHVQEASAGNDPTVTGATRLKIVNNSESPGVVTSPSVPSTTTALTNPFWRDAAVSVSGGTVTAIAVAGTATGLTSGTVIVPSGKSITLTYSAAPSWVWVLL